MNKKHKKKAPGETGFQIVIDVFPVFDAVGYEWKEKGRWTLVSRRRRAVWVLYAARAIAWLLGVPMTEKPKEERKSGLGPIGPERRISEEEINGRGG